MPAPAAQFSPALPWAAGTRGTIVLKDPVSKDDLVNGALTFINGNGLLFQPEGSDGYVDYRDENDSQVLSIAIDDDETKNVLVVGVAQDADVQRVVVGPALGRCDGYLLRKADMSEVDTDETGFLLAKFYKDGAYNYAALTQDGRKVITAKAMENNEGDPVILLLESQTSITVNSATKLSSSEPTGAVADLPRVQVEIEDVSGDAGGLILHAPFVGAITSGYHFLFCNFDQSQIFWGDSVNRIYTY